MKQLHYALAVGKTRHFKQAADACHVSPSALSTAIAELERRIGFQIFERNNKKVLVTPTGRIFLDKAAQIQIQLNDLSQLGKHNGTPLSSSMALGAIPTIGPYLLPKVLPSVRENYPDLRLTIIEDESKNLVRKVRNGELDTAIIALPYPTEGLLVFEFWQEDFYVVTHESDPIGNQSEVTSKALDGTHLLLLQEGHCLKDHILAVCKLQPSNNEFSFAGTSLFTLIQMVSGKMGTTLVPEMALDQLLVDPTLRASHLNEPSPHRKIAMIARPNYNGISDIQLLMGLFEEELSN